MSQPTPVNVTQSGSQNQGDPRIKTEPTYENGLSSYPQNPYINGGGNVSAQQRAAELLRQQYGPHANASIGAIQQQGLHLPGRGPTAPSVHRPQGDPNSNPQYLREQEPLRQQQRDIANAQTDGPDDSMMTWTALVADRRQRHHVLRDQVNERARLVDSGLMTSKPPNSKKRKARNVISSPLSSGASGAQLDGADDIKDEDGDREELDEDAINSDLDDSGDELNQDDEDEEGNSGEVMLCTYDKVQRVKNKWKCVLKDGVLTTGGKEYVFSFQMTWNGWLTLLQIPLPQSSRRI